MRMRRIYKINALEQKKTTMISTSQSLVFHPYYTGLFRWLQAGPAWAFRCDSSFFRPLLYLPSAKPCCGPGWLGGRSHGKAVDLYSRGSPVSMWWAWCLDTVCVNIRWSVSLLDERRRKSDGDRNSDLTARQACNGAWDN
jgi:hypothetical protein